MRTLTIYVDESNFEFLTDVNYEVLNDGLQVTGIGGPMPASHKYSYSGANTLLGYSTSSSAVSPDTNFSVGDTGTIALSNNTIHLYSVQQEPVDITISYAGSQIAAINSSGTKTLLTSGKYCTDDIVVQYTRYSPNLQSKQVSPSTSQQTVSPDSGYDGLSQVTVNAMPSGTATTPATTITANPTISVSASGLITASVSKTRDVTPTVSAGYVSSGTAGTVTVNGSNTQQLTIYNGAHHSVVLISFKIDDQYQGNITTYSAVNGATWTGWVNSEYNTDGFYVDNDLGGVCAASGGHIAKSFGNPVDPAETIIDDTKYYLERGPL